MVKKPFFLKKRLFSVHTELEHKIRTYNRINDLNLKPKTTILFFTTYFQNKQL